MSLCFAKHIAKFFSGNNVILIKENWHVLQWQIINLYSNPKCYYSIQYPVMLNACKINNSVETSLLYKWRILDSFYCCVLLINSSSAADQRRHCDGRRRDQKTILWNSRMV